MSAITAATVTIAWAPLATASASAEDGSPAEGTEEVVVEETTLLDDPARGNLALRELGSELPVAAERNDLEPTELRSLLLEDRTVWLDVQGRVQFIDPAPSDEIITQALADSQVEAPLASPAPLSRTFALHSKPGSTRTIYLDVDGGRVAGSRWVADYAISASQPGWDPADDGASFSTVERERLQKVWAMVAEDFAAYDVDVTTEDPGSAALVKSSGTDTRYGARVVISPSENAINRVCNRGCAGAAYRDSFGVAARQPVWVFPQVLGDDPKLVAEAASHEVGHNLGLRHDGATSHEYEQGARGWAPIMGVGYYQPITQWSRGEYPGATNKEDDLAVIGRYLRRRADESSPAAPAPLSSATGFITSAADIDVVRLGSCAAGARVQVSPAAISPDLDLSATLRDATSTKRASAAPLTEPVDRETATGMDATVRVPTAGKGWQVTIRGTASSDVGYSSYASVGAYTVTAAGCDGATAGVPSPARAITATPDSQQAEVTVAWSPPKVDGASAVTGYVVRLSGARDNTVRSSVLPASARRHTLSGLDLDTEYDVLVSAVNNRGVGRAATANVVTTRLATSAPTAPRSVRARWNDATRSAEVFWARPADDGGLPVTGYLLTLASGATLTLPAADLAAALTQIGAPGRYAATVQAVNAAGASAPVQVVVLVPERPANDDADHAQPLVGAAGRVEGDNTGATGPDDARVLGSDPALGTRSVWFSWRAPRDGLVRFATGADSPTRDTTLAVYTGRRASMVRRAASDDSAGSHLSVVRLPVSAGQTYSIVVDGPATAAGSGAFDLSWVSGTAPDRIRRASVSTTGRGLAVRWAAPRDGGAELTEYEVRVSGQEPRIIDPSTRRTDYHGLARGRYRVQVVARNALGTARAGAPTMAWIR